MNRMCVMYYVMAFRRSWLLVLSAVAAEIDSNVVRQIAEVFLCMSCVDLISKLNVQRSTCKYCNETLYHTIVVL